MRALLLSFGFAVCLLTAGSSPCLAQRGCGGYCHMHDPGVCPYGCYCVQTEADGGGVCH